MDPIYSKRRKNRFYFKKNKLFYKALIYKRLWIKFYRYVEQELKSGRENYHILRKSSQALF